MGLRRGLGLSIVFKHHIGFTSLTTSTYVEIQLVLKTKASYVNAQSEFVSDRRYNAVVETDREAHLDLDRCMASLYS